MTIHLVKMAVGVRDNAHLATIQTERLKQAVLAGGPPVLRHITRHTPKQAMELLDGGSIYWVIKGFIRLRQLITAIEHITDHQGRSACAFVLDPELFKVELKPFNPFQGWRYLQDKAAPADNTANKNNKHNKYAMPRELTAELEELGLL